MLDQIAKAADVVKSPELFRQLVVLVSGFVFLLFVCVLYAIDPASLFSSLDLGKVELGVIYTSISYISGRLLLIVATVFNGVMEILGQFVKFLFQPLPWTTRMKHLGVQLKNPVSRNEMIVRFLTGEKDLPARSPTQLKNELTTVDYARIVAKYSMIDGMAEVALVAMDFVKILLGAALVLLWLFSIQSVFLALAALMCQEKLRRRIDDINYGLYLAAVKYSDRPGDL